MTFACADVPMTGSTYCGPAAISQISVSGGVAASDTPATMTTMSAESTVWARRGPTFRRVRWLLMLSAPFDDSWLGIRVLRARGATQHSPRDGLVSSGRELLARFITLVQAVTKSWTNCACASELPQTSARARSREFEPKTRSMRRLDLSAVSSARYKQGSD